MIRNLLFIGLTVLLVSAIIFITGCGSGDTPSAKNPAGGTNGKFTVTDTNNTEEGAMMAEKQYACPMKEHTQKFTDPNAKCPECGMAVVEIEGDMHGDHDMDGDMGDMHGSDDGHGHE